MDISKDNMRKGYTVAAIIGISLMIGLITVGFIVHTIIKTGTNNISLKVSDYFIYILIGSAFVEYYLVKLLRGIIINNKVTVQSDNLPGPVAKLLTTTIISFGISEISGVLGIVFAFLTGKLLYMYLGIICSLSLYIIFFPKIKQWEELLDEMGRKEQLGI